MRKCRQYSKEFKEKLLAKVFSPNALSTVELAQKAGIPYPTLVTWITMSKKTPNQSNNTIRHSKNKSAETKLLAVSDTLRMTAEEKRVVLQESCACDTMHVYWLCCKKIIWHSQIVNVFLLDEVKQRAHKTAQRLKSLPHQYVDLF